jgi:hypothetical protein
MKDSITNESKSKLDAKLTDNVSIKFTDYAINNFQYDFKPESRLKQGGVKFSNSGIKGLKLFQYKKSKKKYFIQQFWFNKRSNVWTVGEFRLGIFEVKDCRTKVVNIMESHTDDDGRWIKNPKITERYRKDRITKAELENRIMLTVRECIVRLCKADFPKIKKEGTLTSKSAIDIGQVLHKKLNYKPSLWIVREHEKMEELPKSKLCNEIWKPISTDSSPSEKHEEEATDRFMNNQTNGANAFEKRFETNCWACGSSIDTDSNEKCPECNFAIKCTCGKCICDKPGSPVNKLSQYAQYR